MAEPFRYFSHSSDLGIEFHGTLEKAKASAENEIDEYRDCCNPGWPEEVDSVCYGAVIAVASEQVKREPGTDGPNDIGASDYVLL
jgi:hypothetical protein